MTLFGFRRFDEGAAVIGTGWFVRVGRLRFLWAPQPDPEVTKVIADEADVLRLTITWTDLLSRLEADV